MSVKFEQNRKPRMPRVERSSHRTNHHPEDHSWAVSYSDLLMVILSFFVIFFSQDKNKTQDWIRKIVGDSRSVSSVSENRNVALPMQSLSERWQSLENVTLRVDNRNQSVEIQFPDNMYAKNSFELTPKHLILFEKTMAQIAPFTNEIDIIIIGHSDIRVHQKVTGDSLIQNNFDLSSLRANVALREALRLGVPSDSLLTMGSAQNTRNSRSLSIVLRPKGVIL